MILSSSPSRQRHLLENARQGDFRASDDLESQPPSADPERQLHLS
jgi:hypothetical protein